MERQSKQPRIAFHLLHNDHVLLRNERPIEAPDITKEGLRIFTEEQEDKIIHHMNVVESHYFPMELDPDKPRAMVFLARLALAEDALDHLTSDAKRSRSRYFHDFSDIQGEFAPYWTELNQTGFLPIMALFSRRDDPRFAGLWLGISRGQKNTSE